MYLCSDMKGAQSRLGSLTMFLQKQMLQNYTFTVHTYRKKIKNRYTYTICNMMCAHYMHSPIKADCRPPSDGESLM